jgi:hypothetical protein
VQVFSGEGGGGGEARDSVDQCLGALDVEPKQMSALPTMGPEKDTKSPNNPFKGTFQMRAPPVAAAHKMEIRLPYYRVCGPAVYFSWPMVISNSVNEVFVAV